jgi:hypothetical protein
MNKLAKELTLRFKSSIMEKVNMDKFTLGGDNWTVVYDETLNLHGACDVNNQIIYIRDEKARIHELVHAHLWYFEKRHSADEELVKLITNRIEKWKEIYQYEE